MAADQGQIEAQMQLMVSDATLGAGEFVKKMLIVEN